ncbi:MAG: polysaccharide deacetylase family protein [Bryobacteraceae bacterium]
MNLLAQALDERKRSGSPVRIFFRDDDADRDIPELRRLLSIFCSRTAPLNLQVIPATLTAAATDLLAGCPRFIEINQHGWTHCNHEASGKKCEFGPSRTRLQQLHDIRRGKAALDSAFPGRWHPVFTPPWNRFTADTMSAVSELGFRVFSANGDNVRCAPPLVSIPIAIDVFQWKPCRVAKPLEELRAELARWIRRGGPTGILLHHKAMDVTAFATLETLLDELLRHPDAVTLHTFESLCPA